MVKHLVAALGLHDQHRRSDRHQKAAEGVAPIVAPAALPREVVDPASQQVVVKDECPPESLREKVRAAVRYCPTQALRVEEE
jgi:ferredoxin